MLKTTLDMEWRRQWHPTPVLLPGGSQGRGSLVGCSPWGCEDSDIPPADLPDPGIELGSPALQVDSLPAELLGKPPDFVLVRKKVRKHRFYLKSFIAGPRGSRLCPVWDCSYSIAQK